MTDVDEKGDGERRRLVERVLQELYPEECDTVGGENVADIAAGAQFHDEAGGSRNIVIESIEVLANVAGIAALYLQWRSTARASGAGDRVADADAEIVAALRDAQRLELAKRLEVYRLLDRLMSEE